MICLCIWCWERIKPLDLKHQDQDTGMHTLKVYLAQSYVIIFIFIFISLIKLEMCNIVEMYVFFDHKNNEETRSGNLKSRVSSGACRPGPPAV